MKLLANKLRAVRVGICDITRRVICHSDSTSKARKLGCYPDKIRGSNGPSDHQQATASILPHTQKTAASSDATAVDTSLASLAAVAATTSKEANGYFNAANAVNGPNDQELAGRSTDPPLGAGDEQTLTGADKWSVRQKMSQSFRSKLNANSKLTVVSGGLAPPALLPAQSGDTSSSAAPSETIAGETNRKKFILGRGFSLMDWIRLTKDTPDMAGNQGILRRVTYDELAKHNKQDDCWLAIYDKVYNVTPYMKFHPGGVEELMRGAGINATNLFNDVHPWVNLQSMLEKCLVGHLVGPPTVSSGEAVSSTTGDAAAARRASKISVAGAGVSAGAGAGAVGSESRKPSSVSLKRDGEDGAREIPVLDSYQTNESVSVVLYTKCRKLRKECLTIDKPTGNGTSSSGIVVVLFLCLPPDSLVFKYTLDLPAATKDSYDVKVSKEGKIELTLFKLEKIHWWQMCPKLNFSAEIVIDAQTGLNFRACTLTERVRVTHDTDVYCFSLPASSRMWVPLGAHVFVRPVGESMLTKPYTVVSESLRSLSELERGGTQIRLMVKHYADGALTSRLKQLPLGSQMELSNCAGKFSEERLNSHAELVLICAGSGFTPMIRLIDCALTGENISKTTLLFFNKTSSDIMWMSELDELQRANPTRFSVTHILSQAESHWSGRQGRISSSQLLAELIPSNMVNPLFCICGPKQFTELAISLLSSLGYTPEKSIFPFLA